MAANEPNVRKWFAEYEQVLRDLYINSPEQIWSGNETGVQNVPKEEIVVCIKGKLSYQTVAADQGKTSTTLTFVSGVSRVVPLMVVHKGSEVKSHGLGMCQLECTLLRLQKDTSQNTVCEVSKNSQNFR